MNEAQCMFSAIAELRALLPAINYYTLVLDYWLWMDDITMELQFCAVARWLCLLCATARRHRSKGGHHHSWTRIATIIKKCTLYEVASVTLAVSRERS